MTLMTKMSFASILKLYWLTINFEMGCECVGKTN